MKKQAMKNINMKKVTFGTIGAISAAGSAVAIALLASSNDSNQAALNKSIANIGTTTITQNNFPVPTPGGVIEQAFQKDHDFKPYPFQNMTDASFESLFGSKIIQTRTTVMTGSRITGSLNHPRMIFDAVNHTYHNPTQVGTQLITPQTFQSLNSHGITKQNLKSFYVIEGSDKMVAFDPTLSYVDFDLTDWWTNHHDEFPSIKFYFIPEDSSTTWLYGYKTELPHATFAQLSKNSSGTNVTRPWAWVQRNTIELPSNFMPGLIKSSAAGSVNGWDIFVPQLPAGLRVEYAVNYDNYDDIGYHDFEGTTRPNPYTPRWYSSKDLILKDAHFTPATPNLSYRIVVDNFNKDLFSDISSVLDISKVSGAKPIVSNYEQLKLSLNSTGDHIVADLQPNYNPASVVGVFGDLKEFPEMNKDSDYVKPTLTIKDSMDWTINYQGQFGVNVFYSIDGGAKWVSESELKKNSNLYNWQTKTWIVSNEKIQYKLESLNPNSSLKELTGDLVFPATTKKIIDMTPVDFLSKLKSKFNGTSTDDLKLDDSIATSSFKDLFAIEYSIDGGVTWIDKAHVNALNAYNADGTKKTFIERVKPLEANTEFSNSLVKVFPVVNGFTNSASELFMPLELPTNMKIGLLDEWKPRVIGNASTGWSIELPNPVPSLLTMQKDPLSPWEFSWSASSFPNAASGVWDQIYRNYNGSLVSVSSRQSIYSSNPFDSTSHNAKTIFWRLRVNNGPFDANGQPLIDYVVYQLDLSKFITTPAVALSTIAPTVTGTTSNNWNITEPDTTNFTYEYNYNNTTYSSLQTLLANHRDLLDPTTHSLGSITYKVTAKNPAQLSISSSTSSKWTVSSSQTGSLDLARLVANPTISATTTLDWNFNKWASSDKHFEFTFENSWTDVSKIFSSTGIGLNDRNNYKLPSGTSLENQNLWDPQAGLLRVLHWRLKEDSTVTGTIDVPQQIHNVVTYTELSQIPGYLPGLSGTANNYILTSNQTPSSLVPGLKFMFRLEGEDDNSWLSWELFKRHVPDLTDFTNNPPKVRTVQYKIISDTSNASSVNLGLVVDNKTPDISKFNIDVSHLKATERILVNGLNHKVVSQLTNNNFELVVDAAKTMTSDATPQPLFEIKLATNLSHMDSTTNKPLDSEFKTYSVAELSALLSDSHVTKLYWIISMPRRAGHAIDPSSTGWDSVKSFVRGEMDVLDVKIETSEVVFPTPSIGSSLAVPSQENDWSIAIEDPSPYNFYFSMDGNNWQEENQFKTDHYSEFLAIADDSSKPGIQWKAELKNDANQRGYVLASGLTTKISHGEIRPTINATLINHIDAPTIQFDAPSKDQIDNHGRNAQVHYSDLYKLAFDNQGGDLVYEFSVNEHDGYLSQSDFMKLHKNLFVQSGFNGSYLKIYWRAVPKDNTFMLDSGAHLVDHGSVDVDTIKDTFTKVISAVPVTWPSNDLTVTVSNYEDYFSENFNKRAVLWQYDFNSVLDENDPNWTSLHSFVREHKVLLDDITRMALPFYWKAIPNKGFYIEGISRDRISVPTAALMKDPVTVDGATYFPSTFRHNSDGTWQSNDMTRTWVKMPGNTYFQPIFEPTDVGDKTYFPQSWKDKDTNQEVFEHDAAGNRLAPKLYTYDANKQQWVASDGSEVWRKSTEFPDKEIYEMLPSDGDGASTGEQGFPIWAIAVASISGAFLIGVIGYLIYSHVKRKKMDY